MTKDEYIENLKSFVVHWEDAIENKGFENPLFDAEQAKRDIETFNASIEALEKPDVVFCKECVKHNKDIYDFKEDGQYCWKPDSCPLISHRGKAQGHEFDYQYCSCGRRKNETD